jgi:TonB family protein
MRLTAAIVGLALLISSAAYAQTRSAPSLWTAEPSFEDFARAYPEDALKAGVSGVVEISCLVKPDGGLEGCTVTRETPTGAGFGKASLSLTDKFRVRPGALKPDADGVMRVPVLIRWGAVLHPNYIRMPNGRDLASEYPSPAFRAGVAGRAVLRCRVQADGTLANCVITAETPLGYGFGEATLRVAKRFRMKPSTGGSGQGVEGDFVIIPIVWKMAQGQDPLSGERGYVLTHVQPGSSAQRVPCPSAAEPKRVCEAHTISWLEMPTAEELGEILKQNPGLKGQSQVHCVVDEHGALKDCKDAGSPSPAQSAAMAAIAARLKASDPTLDNVTVLGAPVIVIFDWAELATEAAAARRR